MSSLTSAVRSTTDDPFGTGAVDLDLAPVGRFAVDEGGAHHAGQLELAAHDADVAAPRAARAQDGGELVIDRGKKGRPGVAHERDDAVGAVVEQVQDVVGRLEMTADALHRSMVEDLLPPAELAHGEEP